MSFFAVIDTNVIVSGLLNWKSIPGFIIEQAVTGNIIPVITEEILTEYDEVLHREKFCFLDEDIKIFMNRIKKRGIFLELTENDLENCEEIPDVKDIIFYAALMKIREKLDSYLITGNIKHFPVKSYIVNSREMLNILTLKDFSK